MFDPSKHKAKTVRILSSEEPNTIVKLEDGSTIHIRNVILAVHAIYDMDDNRVMNADGSPMYGIHAQTVQYIQTFEAVPENIKRN
jgi:hypothetical protein